MVVFQQNHVEQADPVIDNALDAGNPIPEALQSRAELRQKVRNSADLSVLPSGKIRGRLSASSRRKLAFS